MLNLGAVKLRRWRYHSQGVCPETGRARVASQEEAGDAAGVGKMMISHLERGIRKPSLTLATRLSTMGVCPPEDWNRKPKCIACGIALGKDAPECDKDACEWRAADASAEPQSERAAA